MTACLFHFYPVYPNTTLGPSTAGCRCTTHNFDMGTAPMNTTTSCPIGMIEAKLDAALSHIEARIAQYEQDHHNAERPKDVHPRSRLYDF